MDKGTTKTGITAWLRQRSWKQRVQLLLAVWLVMILLVYTLSARSALALRADFLLRQEQVAVTAVSLARLQSLRREAAMISGDVPVAGGAAAQQERTGETGQLLRMAEDAGLRLLMLPEARQVTGNGVRIHCSSYEFEGAFGSLLRFLHRLEQGGTIHIAHVSFRKQVHPLTRAPRLCLLVQTVAVQQEAQPQQQTR